MLLFSGERVQHEVAMVADVRNPAPALPVHQRLVRASTLQIVIADQLHVVFFGTSFTRRLLPLGCGDAVEHDGDDRETERREPRLQLPHVVLLPVKRLQVSVR